MNKLYNSINNINKILTKNTPTELIKKVLYAFMIITALMIAVLYIFGTIFYFIDVWMNPEYSIYGKFFRMMIPLIFGSLTVILVYAVIKMLEENY